MTTLGQERKPRRVWLKMVIGLSVLALTLTGWLVIERYRAKAALAKYEKELIAKGEKLTFAELTAAVTNDSSNGPEFLALSGALREGSTLTLHAPPIMKLIAPGKALDITKETEWAFQDEKATFRWEDAAVDMNSNLETLHQLRQLLSTSAVHFAVEYQGVNTRFQHLAPCRRPAQWFSVSAVYNAKRGRSEAAVDDLQAIAALTRALQEEPFLISQLVRIAVANIGLNACWTVLQAEGLSDKDLLRLQRAFAGMDLAGPMTAALQGERIFGRDSLRLSRTRGTDPNDLLGGMPSFPGNGTAPTLLERIPSRDDVRGAIRSAIVLPLWRFAWSYEDERHMLEEMSSLIEASRVAKTRRSSAIMNELDKTIERKCGVGGEFRSWRYFATSLLMPVLSKTTQRAHRAETQREMTLTAIALKRYHLRHQKYPQSLDELVPEFLANHPVDWMDGQKLRYRLEGDSFVLWSVGNNGVDDGGKPGQTEPYSFYLAPDFVWPQPASNAEVEAHKEKIRPKR